jgi:hypothetical protein
MLTLLRSEKMCAEFPLDQRPKIPTTPNRAKILHAFPIGAPIRLEIDLTRSQQTRKHYLIGTIRPTSTFAPHPTHHSSLTTRHRVTPFLFDTNKPHKIITVVSLPLKTEEKLRSIRYKFAVGSTGLPAVAGHLACAGWFWAGILIAGQKN